MGHTGPLQLRALTVAAALYDSLDAHLLQAPDIDRAIVPMGMMMSWCVQMQLLAPEVVAAHESLVLRIRYRESRGSELLAACGGDLRGPLFTEPGQRFLAEYYPRYLEDYRRVFGDELYAVEDNWDNYARLAPVITRAYMRGGREPVMDRVSRSLRRLWRRRGGVGDH